MPPSLELSGRLWTWYKDSEQASDTLPPAHRGSIHFAEREASMRTQCVVVCVVLFCAGLGGQALAEDKPTGTPLSGKELKELLTSVDGAITEARSSLGARWNTVYLRTGRAFVQWTGAGTVTQDSGYWRVEGDTLCLKWLKVIYPGVERCTRIHRIGENAYQAWNAEGEQISTFGLRP
jgi:hypothetical protein